MNHDIAALKEQRPRDRSIRVVIAGILLLGLSEAPAREAGAGEHGVAESVVEASMGRTYEEQESLITGVVRTYPAISMHSYEEQRWNAIPCATPYNSASGNTASRSPRHPSPSGATRCGATYAPVEDESRLEVDLAAGTQRTRPAMGIRFRRRSRCPRLPVRRARDRDQRVAQHVEQTPEEPFASVLFRELRVGKAADEPRIALRVGDAREASSPERPRSRYVAVLGAARSPPRCRSRSRTCRPCCTPAA